MPISEIEDAKTSASCHSLFNREQPIDIIATGERDEVKLAQGNTLIIRLPASAATDSDWQLVESNLTQPQSTGALVLEQQGEATLEQVEQPQSGIKEYKTFRFQVTSPGKGTLVFNQQEKQNTITTQTYQLQVQVLGSEQVLNANNFTEPGEASLVKGNTLVVRLPANPGTGYGWQLVENSLAKPQSPNAPVLAQLGEPTLEQVEESDSGLKEYENYRFRVLSPGEIVLALNYQRPWENKPPIQTYQVRLKALDAAEPVMVTANENNGEVTLEQGGTLAVHLKAKPGTGYSWLPVEESNEHLYLFQESILSMGQNVQPTTGAEEVQQFCFYAQSSGESILKFQYRRSWEENVLPNEVYQIKVQSQ
ncbi:MAG: protease inhibitor I42 family protein [Symploca sp. SIO1B1]|nr:protease inhibitor I42 family protein [Symploca sp. SIO1B1]